MSKRKLKIHPPGTPLPPDHPFAKTLIFFVAQRRACTPKKSMVASPPIRVRKNGSDTEAAYLKFRLMLQQFLDVRPCPVDDAETTMEISEAKGVGIRSAQEKSAEAAPPPLVPQRPPDLEDIAFEILRQARYKRSKRLG